MKTKILVVDDEPETIELVQYNLGQAGFTVLSAGDGEEALKLARSAQPALIVLDLTLPELDGFEALKLIRESSELPVIMLTVRADEEERIKGLELGADDYIGKPFSTRELVSRLKAVLRRTDSAGAAPGGREVLRAADVEVDLPRMRVTVAGRPVELTPTEFELLAALVREPGRVFAPDRLPALPRF